MRRNLIQKKDLLLLLPVLFLGALALILPTLTAKPKQALVFDKVTVTPLKQSKIPRDKGFNYDFEPYRDDTRVTVSGYYKFSWLDRHVHKREGSLTIGDIHMTDARGQKYYMLKADAGNSTHNISASTSTNGVRFQTNYSGINVWQFPASLGTLRLRSMYVAQDGSTIPFAVVVRK